MLKVVTDAFKMHVFGDASIRMEKRARKSASNICKSVSIIAENILKNIKIIFNDKYGFFYLLFQVYK